MADFVYVAVVLCAIAVLALVVVLGLRAYASGQSPRDLLFKPRADPRIGVLEYANVDGRRKLVLIRRDDVEHLIMTGGPVDVVIETGIGEHKPKLAEVPAAAPLPSMSPSMSSSAPSSSTGVFSRPARSLGSIGPESA